MTTDFRIERLNLTHFDSVLGIMYPGYFSETFYGQHATFSIKNTAASINAWLNGTDAETLGVFFKDLLVGFAVYDIQNTFYEEKELDVIFFVITKEFRGTEAARLLVKALIEDGKQKGAKIFYAGAASKMNGGGKNDQLWINLFSKFGFELLGPTMIAYLEE